MPNPHTRGKDPPCPGDAMVPPLAETRRSENRTDLGLSYLEEEMGIEILIPLLAIVSIFFIPILGGTIILTTRFALKPLAETIASALRDSGHSPGGERTHQLRDLTEQVQALSEEVQRLREAQEFDRRLLGARS